MSNNLYIVTVGKHPTCYLLNGQQAILALHIANSIGKSAYIS